MKVLQAHIRLERLLDVLSDEIATASDAELLNACAELKMNPGMKGSSALLGVKGIVFPYRRGLLSEGPDRSSVGDSNGSNPTQPQ